MKKIFVNLISCFIFKKKNRHHFRKKYLKNKKMELKNLCYEIKELNEKINYIENLIKSTTDITKLPPAKGLFRTVQLLNLDILIEIDAICRKHNISYWLDFGTLLGSVRHKGFIPWDDDVDVAMLYDDYIKFQEVIQKEEKNFIFKKIPSHIGKCLHKKFVPQTEREWIAFFNWEKQDKLYFANDIFPYYYLNDGITSEKAKEIISIIYSNKIKSYKKNELSLKGFVNVENEMNEEQKKLISHQKCKNIFLGTETINSKPIVFDINDIFPLIELNFEGHNFFVPNKYKKILYDYYGDYYVPEIYNSHLSFSELNTNDLENLCSYNEKK